MTLRYLSRFKTGFETSDLKIMLRMNRWHAPRCVRFGARAATRGGDGWLWEFVGAMVAFFGGEQRIVALCSAALAVGTGILLFQWLKRRIGRARPCAIQPHCWYTDLPPDQFSFPSGHTITAFAVAASIGGFYPEAMPALGFCAACVAVSRVVLGMHYVSDVLAGAALGVALAHGATFAVKALAAA